MPLYEFRCRQCGSTHSQIDSREPPPGCLACNSPQPLKRVWGFQMAKVWHKELNPTTGTMVGDRRQFKAGLREMESKMTDRLGYQQHYVEVDMSDAQSLGVTDEGLDSTYNRRVSEGTTPKWQL